LRAHGWGRALEYKPRDRKTRRAQRTRR
jgi:hypothetical protein